MFKAGLKKSFAFRLLASAINVCFIATFIAPGRVWAQSPADLGLPKPGTMVNLSPAYVPIMIKGITLHPENPLMLDFIVGKGQSNAQGEQFKKESERLIKYFLACLTIPDDELWVNLSPYEKDRIVPNELGQTDLGRDMLAQDYVLKQLTASLIYPEKNLGKDFWNRVYQKARQVYGTTQIPVNTFNKVWILADTAKVHENKDTVFVIKSHLKIMLDEDYLALSKNSVVGAGPSAGPDGRAQGPARTDVNQLGSQIIRQIILPELEKEVNQGKNFAALRQMYNSMILAVWFKSHLKEAFLNQVYTDKRKISGVDVGDKTIKQQIYQQYLKAYKKGVFNYIKEDPSTGSGQAPIARKYFSGGLVGPSPAMIHEAMPFEVEAFGRQESGEEMERVRTLTPPAFAVPARPAIGASSAAMVSLRKATGIALAALTSICGAGGCASSAKNVSQAHQVENIYYSWDNMVKEKIQKLETFLKTDSTLDDETRNRWRDALDTVNKILTSLDSPDLSPEEKTRLRLAVNHILMDIQDTISTIQSDKKFQELNSLLKLNDLLQRQSPKKIPGTTTPAMTAAEVKPMVEDFLQKNINRSVAYNVDVRDSENGVVVTIAQTNQNQPPLLPQAVISNLQKLTKHFPQGTIITRLRSGSPYSIPLKITNTSTATTPVTPESLPINSAMVVPIQWPDFKGGGTHTAYRLTNKDGNEMIVDPRSAAIWSLTINGQEMYVPNKGTALRGNQLMFLFSSRLPLGQGITFEGRSMNLMNSDRIRKVSPILGQEFALHGFSYAGAGDPLEWRFEGSGEDEQGVFITLSVNTTLPLQDLNNGIYQNFETLLTYRLNGSELVTEEEFINNSDKNIPLGGGMHPFINVDRDKYSVRVPANKHRPLNEQTKVPLDELPQDVSGNTDFREWVNLKDLKETIETAFTDFVRDANGNAVIEFRNNETGEIIRFVQDQFHREGMLWIPVVTPENNLPQDLRNVISYQPTLASPSALYLNGRKDVQGRVIDANLTIVPPGQTFTARSSMSVGPTEKTQAIIAAGEKRRATRPIPVARTQTDLASVTQVPHARLLMPTLNFQLRKPIDVSPIRQRIKDNGDRTPQEVIEMIRQYQQTGGTLTMETFLRGPDGPGSSLDLTKWRFLLTAPGISSIHDLPVTTVIASGEKAKISFELASDPDTIEYVAPQYKYKGKPITREHPYVVKGEVQLKPDGRLDNETRQLDMVAYIFHNIFGLKGIRIVLEETSELAKAGGMESSNAFNMFLVMAASILSGANISYADGVKIAVSAENFEGRGGTGGQGHWAAILGRIQRLFWLSGVKNASGEYVNNEGVIAQEMDPKKTAAIEEHMLLLQAGKEYTDSGDPFYPTPAFKRAADLTNDIWTHLMEFDPRGREIALRMLTLAYTYTFAIESGDFEAVGKTIDEYVDLRDELTRLGLKYISEYGQHHESANIPDYAKELGKKVFDQTAYPTDFQANSSIREWFMQLQHEGHVDEFTTNSLYTLGARDFIDEARREDIHLFAVGAGGPRTIMMASSKKDQAYMRRFFQSKGLGEAPIDNEYAKRFVTPRANPTGEVKILKGFFELKVGNDPMKIEGFDKLKDPKGRPVVIPQLPELETVTAQEVKLAEPSGTSKAQTATGGIDLNAKNLKMETEGQKIDIRFDPAMIAQFKRGDFSGVRPVIINIKPIPSILPLLGLAPAKEQEQLVKI